MTDGSSTHGNGTSHGSYSGSNQSYSANNSGNDNDSGSLKENDSASNGEGLPSRAPAIKGANLESRGHSFSHSVVPPRVAAYLREAGLYLTHQTSLFRRREQQQRRLWDSRGPGDGRQEQ